MSMTMMKKWSLLACLALAACSSPPPPPPKPVQAEPMLDPVARNVKERLEQRGFRWGAPLYLRIFKTENVLEAWVQKEGGHYELYQRFPICVYSGELGPKLRQGDKQSPEGFYKVGLKALNPNSQYHLSFNLGYPNAYDRAHGYTGNYLMVHGDCVSVGCYAMGDRQIEEIYTLVGISLQYGQKEVPVHIFPFHLTTENMIRYGGHRWASFWQMLKPGYDYFESYRYPPVVDVVNKRYEVNYEKTAQQQMLSGGKRLAQQ